MRKSGLVSLPKHLLIQLAIVFNSLINLGRDGDDAIAMNQLAAQLSDQYLVMAQHGIGMHQHGHFCGLMSDEGVAISIAADPRTKIDKSGQRIVTKLWINLYDCVFDIAIDFRYGGKKTGIKIMQAIINLIIDQGFTSPHLI